MSRETERVRQEVRWECPRGTVGGRREGRTKRIVRGSGDPNGRPGMQIATDVVELSCITRFRFHIARVRGGASRNTSRPPAGCDPGGLRDALSERAETQASPETEFTFFASAPATRHVNVRTPSLSIYAEVVGALRSSEWRCMICDLEKPRSRIASYTGWNARPRTRCRSGFAKSARRSAEVPSGNVSHRRVADGVEHNSCPL